MGQPADECLSDEVFEQLNAGTLSDSELEYVSEHIAECDSCAAKLDAQISSIRETRDLSIDESRVAELLARISEQTQDVDDTPFEIPGLEHTGPTMRGGLGEVTIYRDTLFHRKVAVKTLKREAAVSPSRVLRFRQEYEATSLLQNRGVPAVYSRGTLPDDREYYVMQFIEGQTFQKCVSQFHSRNSVAITRGSRDFVSLINHLISIAETIGAAHRRNLLHRDLKPLNIVIDDDDRAIVLDWGLACLIGEHDHPDNEVSSHLAENLTVDGTGLGTISYMSPEQATGENAAYDCQTDVYGLGAMLFEILCGDPPHGRKFLPADSPAERMQKIADGHHPIPMGSNSIPRELVSICRKAIHPDKSQRMNSAEELIQDLQAWLSLNPVKAHRYSVGESITRLARRFPKAMFASVAVLAVGAIATSLAAFTIQGQRETIRTERTKFMLNLGSMIEIVRPEIDNLSPETRRSFVTLSRESLPDLYATDTDSPKALRAAARARHTDGLLLLNESEKFAEARLRLEDAYEMIQSARRRFPDDIDIQRTEIDIMISLSRAYAKEKDVEAARALSDEFTKRLRELGDVIPQNGIRFLNQLTRVTIGTGDLLADTGYKDECIALLRQAIAAAPVQSVLDSENQSFFDAAWIIRQNLILELRDSAPADAVPVLKELRQIQNASPRGQKERNVTHIQDEVWVEKYHADIFRRIDRTNDAKQCMLSAERLIQDLRSKDLNNARWLRDLSDVYSKLAMISQQQNNADEERKYLLLDYEMASQTYSTSVIQTRNFASITCRRLAEFYAERNEVEKARRYFEKARSVLEPHLAAPERKTMIALKTIADAQAQAQSLSQPEDRRRSLELNGRVAKLAAQFVQSDPENLLNQEAVANAIWQQIQACDALIANRDSETNVSALCERTLELCNDFKAASEEILARLESGNFRQKPSTSEADIRDSLAKNSATREQIQAIFRGM